MIPKIIIQTWKTEKIPSEVREFIEKLKYNNPDFEYKFYTDKDIDVFIKSKFPEYYSTFISFEYTIQKIDFFRYLCVYYYGGFYFDIDMDINQTIRELCKYECVFPKESYTIENIFKNKNLLNKNVTFLLGNYAFGAIPNHPFLKLCIDNIVNKKVSIEEIPYNYNRFNKQISNKLDELITCESYMDHVLYTTGPVLISLSYIDYQHKNKITIIEPKPFKKFSFGKYGKHLAIGTWKGIENIIDVKVPQFTEQLQIKQNDCKVDLEYEIYYINLDRSTERNKLFINHYQNINRIQAYDGDILQSYDNVIIDKKLLLSKKNTELACCLSHIKAIIKAYNDGKKEVLIMEDDVYANYKSLWTESIKEIIENSPIDTMCIQLHLLHPSIIYSGIINNTKYIKWGKKKNLISTACYYINRQGMERINNIYLNSENKIVLDVNNCNGHADDMCIYDKINTYTYLKPLFDHQIKHSNIHNQHLYFHSASLDVIKSYFKLLPGYNDIEICCICRQKIDTNHLNLSDTSYLLCSCCSKLEEYKQNIVKIHIKCKESFYKSFEWKNMINKIEKCNKQVNYNRDVQYYTLKSDQLKKIFFWNPGCCSTILKKFIYYIEEGFLFNGYNIHKEIGDYNYNKYFIEITEKTLQKYNNYEKILIYKNPVERVFEFCEKNNIDLNDAVKNYELLLSVLPKQTKYINEILCYINF